MSVTAKLLTNAYCIRASTEQPCAFEPQKAFADIKHIIATWCVTPHAQEPCCEGLCFEFALRSHQCHTDDSLHRACELLADKTLVVCLFKALGQSFHL